MIKIIRLSGARIIVLLLDCLFIYVSYLLSYNIKFSGDVPADQWQSFLSYAPWLGLFAAITFYFFNLYDFTGRQKPAKWLYNLILAHIVFIVELIVLHYWFSSFSLPRSVVSMAFLIQIVLTFSLRLMLFSLQKSGIRRKPTIVVINGQEPSLAMLQKLLVEGKTWFDIQRVLVINEEDQESNDVHWDDIDVLIFGQDIPSPVKTDLIRTAGRHNVEVLLIPDFYELYLMKAELQQVDDLLVYSMMPPELTIWERFAKRCIDLVISSVLLILSSPVMLLMYFLIPLTSPGKSTFVQDRIGLHEQEFTVFKFRSMVQDAEKNTGPVLAAAKDARVTKLGQFIRATRIDELPQLFNVIRGEMSLVGPRPERAFFVDQFKEELPHYTYRLMVKPGLTGLAQVMANYTTSPSEKLRYDIMYIKNYSPILDLKILFQTIVVVLRRDQAKGLDHSVGMSHNIEQYLQNTSKETASTIE